MDTHDTRAFGRTLGKDMQGVDGIICNNELTALAIIGGLNESEQVLGNSFDLVCKRTTEILPLLYPNLDTVTEDLYSTGKELANLLIRNIEGTEAEELQTLHEPLPNWQH